MPSITLGLVIGGFGIIAALMGLAAIATRLGDHERRITGLESDSKELARANRHDRLGRAQSDIAESFLFALISMSEDAKILQTKLDHYTGLAEHLRNGGKPDDKPK